MSTRLSVMKNPEKSDFPVGNARHFLETGPIVLVSSRLKDKSNIMTMGWHCVMQFTPSLIGCMISSGNHSFRMIRDSGECVINLPTTRMTDKVVGIGNCSGADADKFQKFKLTAQEAEKVAAPLIGECHANFECRLYEDALVEKYSFFVFEVVKAHAATSPEYPKTLHYTGDGVFMVAGRIIDKRDRFQPWML